jgi:hypothetical protein
MKLRVGTTEIDLGKGTAYPGDFIVVNTVVVVVDNEEDAAIGQIVGNNSLGISTYRVIDEIVKPHLEEALKEVDEKIENANQA